MHAAASAAENCRALSIRRPSLNRHNRVMPGDVLRIILLLAAAVIGVIALLRQGEQGGLLASTFEGCSGSPKSQPGGVRSSYSRLRRDQWLAGALFLPLASAASSWSGPELVEHEVAVTVVATFSPLIEDHVRLMFEDKFGECRFHAMGPAMVLWQGIIVTSVRVFLPQYVEALRREVVEPMDTWQENYVYTMRLRPDDYTPIGTGRLLGIPTPVNAGFSYRKDGPMDPRAFVYKGRLFLIYYSHGTAAWNTTARCRMYFWDYARSIKRLISVTGVPLQSADINWTPLVVGNDTLYLVYTFDPLRVLLCDPDEGQCTLHFSQVPMDQYPFDRAVDLLRGGTPFVEYLHPYYISLAHSAVPMPPGIKATYSAHFVVIRVNPWSILYVSDSIEAHLEWLDSTELVMSDYITGPFWYPTSLLIRDDDTLDVGCHLNDHSSYVVRLTGTKRLLAEVVELDRNRSELSATVSAAAIPPPVRAVQSYVSDRYLQRQRHV